MALTDLFNTYDVLYTPTDYPTPNLDIYDFPDFYNESVKPQSKKAEKEITPQWFTEDIIVNNMKSPSTTSNKSSSYKLLSSSQRQAQFNKYYDEIEQEDPDAKQYRALLTAIADHESRINPTAKNPNAPAYGYFQFMQDGTKWNNISKYSNLNIDDFLNDPKSQIRAAIKLAKAFSSSISPTAKEVAARRGITESGLIGGAWLGGAGGVNRYLINGKDASDAYWYGGKGGSKVSEAIQRYNKL